MDNLVELKRQRDKMLREARSLLSQAEITNQRIGRAEYLEKLEEEGEEEFEDSWDESWESSGC